MVIGADSDYGYARYARSPVTLNCLRHVGQNGRHVPA